MANIVFWVLILSFCVSFIRHHVPTPIFSLPNFTLIVFYFPSSLHVHTFHLTSPRNVSLGITIVEFQWKRTKQKVECCFFLNSYHLIALPPPSFVFLSFCRFVFLSFRLFLYSVILLFTYSLFKFCSILLHLFSLYPVVFSFFFLFFSSSSQPPPILFLLLIASTFFFIFCFSFSFCFPFF